MATFIIAHHGSPMTYDECKAHDPGALADEFDSFGRFVGGWRLVRPGGWLQAYNAFWRHEELLAPMAGQRVWVSRADDGAPLEVMSRWRDPGSMVCCVKTARSKADFLASQRWLRMPRDTAK